MKAARPVAKRAFGSILAIGIVYAPVMVFLVSGIAGTGVRDSVAHLDVLSLARTLARTLVQATLSAAVAVIVSLPGAYIFGRLKFAGYRFARALTLVPFVLPSIVVVVGIIGFWGGEGLVTRIVGARVFDLYGLEGIVLAHVFFNVSFSIRMIGEAWERVADEYREASLLDGAGAVTHAARIVLPLIAPAAIAAFILVFIYSSLSFGIVLVFGGVSFSTLEVRIYQELATYADPAAAAWVGIVQIGYSALMFVSLVCVLPILETRRSSIESRKRSITSLSRLPRYLLLLYFGLLIVFVAGPILAIAPRAGVEGFRAVLAPATAARSLMDAVGRSVVAIAGTSISIALVSAVACFSLSYLLAKRRSGVFVSTFAHLPLGVSFVSFAIGLRVAAVSYLHPVVLIILANVFLSFTVVYRMLATAIGEFPADLSDAAKLSGAGMFRIAAYIEFPALKRSFAGAFAYALAIPLADLTGVITIGRGRIVTFPVAIYRMLGFRHFKGAFALSFVYVVLVALIFIASEPKVNEP